jgi:4,5-DOPA dioxygenase extradiol
MTTAATTTATTTTQTRMPVLFVGHGSPMNALEDNRFTRQWRELGAAVPEPKAIVMISAHWLTQGTHVTSNVQPKTIHDFGGFPRALFQVQYPARGDPGLARSISDLLSKAGASSTSTEAWGLDHGTWSVLQHLRARADVPVVQVSIDPRLPPARHLELGASLAPLREQGVLLMGSGNITHNLRRVDMSQRFTDDASVSWAARFDGDVAAAVIAHDRGFLTRALETADGREAHPSDDHWLPLLYAAGAADDDDDVSFPVTGFDLGSFSMRAVRFG